MNRRPSFRPLPSTNLSLVFQGLASDRLRRFLRRETLQLLLFSLPTLHPSKA